MFETYYNNTSEKHESKRKNHTLLLKICWKVGVFLDNSCKLEKHLAIIP